MDESSWEFLKILRFRLSGVASEFFFESLFFLSLWGLLILENDGLLDDFGLLAWVDFHFIVKLFYKGDLELDSGLGKVFFGFFIEIFLVNCKSSSSGLHFIFINLQW